eukprot:4170218-Pyramimonas_sp.AAC.1
MYGLNTYWINEQLEAAAKGWSGHRSIARAERGRAASGGGDDDQGHQAQGEPKPKSRNISSWDAFRGERAAGLRGAARPSCRELSERCAELVEEGLQNYKELAEKANDARDAGDMRPLGGGGGARPRAAPALVARQSSDMQLALLGPDQLVARGREARQALRRCRASALASSDADAAENASWETSPT